MYNGNCYEIYDGSEWYASVAVQVAKEDGWKIQGPLAICPACQEAGVTFNEIRSN